MPLITHIHEQELIEQEMPDDSSELGEFFEEPVCGLNMKDGTCSNADSYYCRWVCRDGETGGRGG